MLDEFEVREILGVAVGPVVVTERDKDAVLAIGMRETVLTTHDLRKLARYLNRIAGRIELRTT